VKTIHGDGFGVEVPDGWERIEQPAGAFTLAQPEGGTGALQLSIAAHATDTRPLVGDLRDIITAMAEKNQLSAPVDISYFDLPALRGAEATFHHGDDFIRVWSVSDGSSYALATYVCRRGSETREADACDAIVRSVRFSPAVA
jgi:hypothetical protein